MTEATQQAIQATVTGTAAIEATISAGLLDSDSDGLSNYIEKALGLDPNKPDTDEDGLLDGEEVDENNVPRLGTDPKNPDSDDDDLGVFHLLKTGSFGIV